jgi:hypothetical protein
MAKVITPKVLFMLPPDQLGRTSITASPCLKPTD